MEPPKEKKPFITVKEAIISVLVIVLFAVAFEKPFPILSVRLITPRSVTEAEVQQYAEQIELIPTEKIEKSLKESGNPTLVIIYTSWCPYCKKLMNNVASLRNEGKIKGINLLPLSVDKQKTPLSRYVLERGYDQFFTPYMMDSNTVKEFGNTIIAKGGYFDTAIPYSIIFDRNGNLVESIRGSMDKDLLLSKLENAKNK